MHNVTVIVPTYNESDAIEPLFDRLNGVLCSLDYEVDVLVVDDNSPDGTATVVQDIRENYMFEADVIIREEDPGLGPSVVCGLKHTDADACVVMDADLQHPPETIPELLAGLSQGSDVVVGSRRAKGGEYGDWSLFRHLVSRVGDNTARFAVPAARGVSDPLSGFFALDPDAIDMDSLSPKGFKILLEILSSDPTLDVSEVGFEFGVRENGESKADLTEAIRFIEHLTELRVESSPISRIVEPRRAVQMAEFGFIGAVGTVVNTIVFLLALQMETHYLVAGLLAFGVAVHWNYIGNRLLTFDETQPEKSELAKYAQFNAVSIGGLVVYQLFLALTMGVFSAPPEISNVTAILLGSIWNYFGAENIAFNAA